MRSGLNARAGLLSRAGAINPNVLATFDRVEDRPLIQHPREEGSRVFRDFLHAMTDQSAEFRGACVVVLSRSLLANAIGVGLDVIGRRIGMPRSGLTDERYRQVLLIREIVLESGQEELHIGTVDSLLRIARAFVGAGPPIQLINVPPYAFQMEIPGLPVNDVGLLAGILSSAVYAGVLGLFEVSAPGGNLYGSIHATTHVQSGSTASGSTSDEVVVSAPLGVLADDRMLITIMVASGITVTDSPGWFGTLVGTGGSEVYQAFRTADSSDAGASYTFPLSASTDHVEVIVAVNNPHGDGTGLGANQVISGGTSNAPTCDVASPPATGNTGNQITLRVIGFDGSDPDPTFPTGLIPLHVIANTNRTIIVGWEVLPDAGIGTSVFGTSSAEEWTSYTVPFTEFIFPVTSEGIYGSEHGIVSAACLYGHTVEVTNA